MSTSAEDRSPGQILCTSSGTPQVFDRPLIVSEHHLRRVLTEYLRHCNAARPPEINLAEIPDRRKQVLGGLTHGYQIAA